MKTSLNPLKTAGMVCLAAGLVSTWDVPSIQAAEYDFSGEITPTTDLTDVYFLFAVGTCQPGGGVFAQEISSFIPANTTDSFSLSFDSIPDGLGGSEGYAIAGLYDPANGGVSLSYDSGWAASTLAVNPTPEWNGYWLPIGGSIEAFANESDVAAGLADGFSGGVPFAPDTIPFPGTASNPDNPSSITMVDYSAAANGGTGTVVEGVPEPSTWASLTIGTTLLYACRCSRRPARS